MSAVVRTVHTPRAKITGASGRLSPKCGATQRIFAQQGRSGQAKMCDNQGEYTPEKSAKGPSRGTIRVECRRLDAFHSGNSSGFKIENNGEEEAHRTKVNGSSKRRCSGGAGLKKASYEMPGTRRRNSVLRAGLEKPRRKPRAERCKARSRNRTQAVRSTRDKSQRARSCAFG